MLHRPENLAQLMQAANGGDAAAYRLLLSALAPMVRAFARRELARFGRRPDEAEDIVQETLLAIHLKRQTWDTSQRVEPWVHAIARHKLIDMLRRRGFAGHVSIEDCGDLSELTVGANQVHAAECSDLLARLPERDRAIVQGIAIEGRSAREIGERLGMGEGAVRVALHRALKAMAAAEGSGPA